MGTSPEGVSSKKIKLHTLLIRFSAQDWPKLVPSKFFVAVFPATTASLCDGNFRHFSSFEYLLSSRKQSDVFSLLWAMILD